jgi:hypothetical protein
MSAKNEANTTWTVAAARKNSVKPGAWVRLTASYQRSTGEMNLHINNVEAASAKFSTPWKATGPFRFGAGLTSASVTGGYFHGQMAQVLTYDVVVVGNDANPALRDFDGDNNPDYFAIDSSGQLFLYNGNGADGFHYGYGLKIGTGWGGFTSVLTTDFNNDANPDVIARAPDGSLVDYHGSGGGQLTNGKGSVIGTGWNTFDTLFTPGDFNNDGFPDVIARKPDGTLWLYKGNGADKFINGTGISLGGGWDTYNSLLSTGDFDEAAADNTGTRGTDIIARKPDGSLWLHRGNGNKDTPNLLDTHGTLVGQGWNNYSILASPGDFNSDRHSDLIARDFNGHIYIEHANGNGGLADKNPRNIGSGWSTYVAIF